MLDFSNSSEYDKLAAPATGVPVPIPPMLQFAVAWAQIVTRMWAPWFTQR